MQREAVVSRPWAEVSSGNMIDEKLLGRITANPEIFGGKPIIRGMRISVEMILSLLAQGEKEETFGVSPRNSATVPSFHPNALTRFSPLPFFMKLTLPRYIVFRETTAHISYQIGQMEASLWTVSVEV